MKIKTILTIIIWSLFFVSCKEEILFPDEIDVNINTNHIIYGSITYPDGYAISGVEVSIADPLTDEIFSDYTDYFGNYVLPEVSEGLAKITFKKNNFILVNNNLRVGDFDRKYNGFLIQNKFNSTKVYNEEINFRQNLYLFDFSLGNHHLTKDTYQFFNFKKVEIHKRILQMNSHSNSNSYEIEVYEIPFDIDWDENNPGPIDFNFFDSYEPIEKINGQYSNTIPNSSNIDFEDVVFNLTSYFNQSTPMNGLAFVFTIPDNRNYFWYNDISINLE
jgi:hypothetical protein